jgi:hypothetical protein
MNRQDLFLRAGVLAGVPGFPSSASASALAKIDPRSLFGSGGLNLATFYGVSPNHSSASNAAAIMKAFADSGGFTPLYLPAGRYPCDPILLPNTPISWQGDGKDTSVLVFPPSVPYGLSYDNSSAGRIPPNSPWYPTHKNGANSNHAWTLRGLGFEGGDWTGSTANAGLYFPNWDPPGGHDGMALRMFYVGVYLFNGPGIVYEISGLVGDSEFVDIDVASCSGIGLIPGSDQRWVNMLAHDCGSWGVRPSDHRNTQLLGGKAYGNGQLDDAGGYYITGNETLLSNLYTQDNNGPGFLFNNATLVQGGQLFADRNCVSGIDSSGMIINNCNGILIDGYGATDTQRTTQQHALKVTGSNSQGVVRLIQVQTNSALGSAVESNSGGVTVYSPT